MGILDQTAFRFFKHAMVVKEHYQIVMLVKASRKGHELILKYRSNRVLQGSHPLNFPHMKGGDIMVLVLERDMEKLFGDTKKVKQGLEVLERDHVAWTRDREREDLMDILEGVKGLESDVSILMGDCVSLGQVKQNNGIKGDVQQAFKGLNLLFEDLKTVRKEIDQSYASQGKLEQLEIDWARFRKTVEQIQEDLQQG